MKEARWARRLRAGDSTAWLQLIEHWSPRLYSYVLYNVETEDEAQVVVQAIFAEIVQTVVGSLHIPNLNVLLFSVAYQQVLRYHQQRRYLPAPPYPPFFTSADMPTDVPEDQSATFWENFQKFLPECQQILLLYYVCGVSLSEISQIVGEQESVLLRVLRQAKAYLLRP